jgi:hypothetical protein
MQVISTEDGERPAPHRGGGIGFIVEPDVVNFSVALSGLGLRWDTLTQASAFAVIFRPFRPYFP